MADAVMVVSSEKDQENKRGFTLTEIAIVLGIIGLILGSIWVAAGAVYNNLRVSKAQTELIQITQAVRSLYATQAVTGDGSQELTAALVAAKVFPTDTVNSGTGANNAVTSPVGPWVNSHIRIYSTTNPNTGGQTGDSFQVLFQNVPQSACIALATSASGTGRDTALLSVNFVATSAGTLMSPTANFSFPVNVVTANTGCSGTTDDVAFTFALRG